MKPIFHEVQPVNGIPTIPDQQIRNIMSRNSFREEKYKVTTESLAFSLERLRRIYAEHTGRNQPTPSNDHAPCMGLDGKCGSTDFMRTGTCFVCLNCQTSQGCS